MWNEVFGMNCKDTKKCCAVCDKKTTYAFSIEKGGVVCKNHASGDDLETEYVNIIMLSYLGKMDKLTSEVIDSIPINCFSVIDDIVSKYYDHYLSIKL